MNKLLFLIAVVALLSVSACRSKTCPAYSKIDEKSTKLIPA